MGRFDGRAVLITGAASGIGEATARRFADEGARLALADLNEDGGRALAKDLGDETLFQGLDVSDREAVQSFTDAAAERFGRLDVVVNNAGIGTWGEAPDLDPEIWKKVIEVDLYSIFYGCRAAIPHMRSGGGGAIVNTASISGLHGDYGFGAYNAAKGGVVNYTRSLAIDHARENIRVNAVCPGPIETPLAAPLMQIGNIAEDYRRCLPMGRLGRADEVAGTITFLASDDASYVTGAMLVVDGGLTAATGQPNFSEHIGAMLRQQGQGSGQAG